MNTTQKTSTKTKSVSFANHTKKCKWFENKFCNVKPLHCIGDKCDLYTVKYEEDDIKKQIEYELNWIQNNKKEKQSIQDKIMGLKVLTEGLQKIKGLPKLGKVRSLWQLRKLIKKKSST